MQNEGKRRAFGLTCETCQYGNRRAQRGQTRNCKNAQTNYTARWISTKPCAGDGSRVSPINYGITPLWPSDPEMQLAWSSEWEYNAFLLPLHSYIAHHRRFTATLFSEILPTEITAKKQSAMLWTKHDGAQTWVIEDIIKQGKCPPFNAALVLSW